MASKKPRNKKYHPKRVVTGPKFLNNLPMPDDRISELVSATKNRLVSMRLSERHQNDITSVAMFFGICWLLAEKMKEEKPLQDTISRGILLLTREWKMSGPLGAEAYTAAMEVTDLLPQILKAVSVQEYLDASALIRDSGTLDQIDGHLNKAAERLEQAENNAA